jgi:glyoxylase-like metal-dependent hydrolase (beta-lactamase superfamily II)
MFEEIHPAIKTVTLWWDVMRAPINAFVVKAGHTGPDAMIDSGPPQATVESMVAALKPVGIALENIKYVLHTHGHIDHIGGDTLFRESCPAKIMIHREDALFLENRALSFDRSYTPGKRNVEFHRKRFLSEIGPNLTVDHYLEDGEVIDLGHGVRLRVIHLSGHTPGSCGFYWEREGVLVCGDSIPGLSMRGGFLPIIEDLPAYIKTIEKVKQLPLNKLILGHPYRGRRLGPSLVHKGDDIEEYLRDASDVAHRLENAILHQAENVNGRGLLEIADSVVSELPGDMGFKKMGELNYPDWSLSTIAFALNRARAEA